MRLRCIITTRYSRYRFDGGIDPLFLIPAESHLLGHNFLRAKLEVEAHMVGFVKGSKKSGKTNRIVDDELVEMT
jgi:hypothetical protein